MDNVRPSISHSSGSLNHCIFSKDCAITDCKDIAINKIDNTRFFILNLF